MFHFLNCSILTAHNMSTFSSFAPIYYHSFYYGLLGPWWSRDARPLKVLSLTSVLINATLLVLFIFYGNGNVPSSDARSVSVYLNYIIIVGYSLIDALVLGLCLIHRNHIQRLFRCLEEIDQLLAQVNIQINHSRIQWLNWGMLGLVQGLNVLQVVSTFLINPMDTILRPIVLFGLFYKQFYHQAHILLVVAVVNSILWRFKALNAGMEMLCSRQFLGGCHSESGLMCLKGVLRRPTRSTICHFGVIHDRLCQTLRVVGKCFGVQVRSEVELWGCNHCLH